MIIIIVYIVPMQPNKPPHQHYQHRVRQVFETGPNQEPGLMSKARQYVQQTPFSQSFISIPEVKTVVIIH